MRQPRPGPAPGAPRRSDAGLDPFGHERRHLGVALGGEPLGHPPLSAAVRFWLTFHLPTSDATGISIPTMPRIWAATNGSGASETAQGAARPASIASVSAPICARSQAGSSIAEARPRASSIT